MSNLRAFGHKDDRPKRLVRGRRRPGRIVVYPSFDNDEFLEESRVRRRLFTELYHLREQDSPTTRGATIPWDFRAHRNKSEELVQRVLDTLED
jgi:hypothetical protein